MYTLEECEKLWAEAGRHGSRAQRIERSKRWLPYFSYLAGQAQTAPFRLPERPNDLVAHLVTNGILNRGDSVLDIGAGTGGYALEFARQGCAVTALDPNADCLEVLRDRAEGCGLPGIRTVQSTWEEFVPEERYDVSFSAMCPAICGPEELGRMEDMTRRFCCLVTVMRGSCEKHRRAMMRALDIHPQGGMATEAIHYYNVLYLMGRRPEVKCMAVDRRSGMTVEEAMERYPIYFEIFGVGRERSVPFLRDYLAQNAENGYLEEESHLELAMVYWRPGKQ